MQRNHQGAGIADQVAAVVVIDAGQLQIIGQRDDAGVMRADLLAGQVRLTGRGRLAARPDRRGPAGRVLAGRLAGFLGLLDDGLARRGGSGQLGRVLLAVIRLEVGQFDLDFVEAGPVPDAAGADDVGLAGAGMPFLQDRPAAPLVILALHPPRLPARRRGIGMDDDLAVENHPRRLQLGQDILIVFPTRHQPAPTVSSLTAANNPATATSARPSATTPSLLPL